MTFQLAQRKWRPYVLLLLSGCMPLDEGLSERQGMTLDEYKSFVGKSASDSLIMPERASRISHGSLSGRDSWNTWWKIEGVDTTSKAALISALAKQLEKTGFFRVGEDAQTQKNSTIPPLWPKASEIRPAWWKDCGGAEAHSWEKEMQSTSVRSLGWLLAYDQKLEIIYIWNWNYQHSLLGWSDEQREVVAPTAP